MVTISPGEKPPVRELAALTTAPIWGVGAVTVRATLMVSCRVPEPPLKVTEPAYEPAPRLAGFAETVRVEGVVAALCVTESQPVLAAVAVNATAGPVAVTDTVCAAGGGLPAV